MPLLNPKIDAELGISLMIPEDIRKNSETLDTGFDMLNNTWSVIVKYNGDLEPLANQLGAKMELLSEKYAILTIDEDKINTLAGYSQIDYIEKSKVIARTVVNGLREACIRPVQTYNPYKLDGTGVILGIIDSGIDYMHPDFINEDGTSRILYIWDMSIEGKPPKGFTVGTEYTKDQINKAIKAPNNEERFNILPHQDTVGHGTHVAVLKTIKTCFFEYC